MVNNECKMVKLKGTCLRRRLLAFYLAALTFSRDLSLRLEGRGFSCPSSTRVKVEECGEEFRFVPSRR